MGEDEVEAVLAGLGQNGREGVRGKALGLFQVQVEVSALVFWLALAGQGREVELSDEEGSKQPGLVISYSTGGQVHKNNAALVHNLL